MAVIVASMVGIVLTAAGVLGTVYAMHVAAQSPRFRARVRRHGFAVAARLYDVRRQVGYRLRRAAGAARRTLRQVRPAALRTVATVRRRLATGAPPYLARRSAEVRYVPVERVPAESLHSR